VAESAIVYDPHLQFVPPYFNEKRGDVILNPLDARCPSWSPSDEIDFTDASIAEAQALAQATSLFVGSPSDRNWFFTYCSQLIWKHCICEYRPDAHEMAYLMQHSDPLIDVMVEGTELEQMMAVNAQQQRAGVVSHLTQIAYALRQIPKKEKGRRHFSLREYCNERKSWLFFTNTQDTRAALRPIQSLMLDSLINRLLSMGERSDLPSIVMVIDELQTLQKLPQLMPLMTEGRKTLRVVIGFQGRSQIKALYGEEAEAIFSAAFTKFMMRTSEKDASEWLSGTVGDIEIERLRESRPAGLMGSGKGSGHTYSTEQKIERLLIASEFQGLDDLRGYLKYGNLVVPVEIPIMPKRIVQSDGFVARKPQPIEKKPLPVLEEVLAEQRREAEAREQKKRPAASPQPLTNPTLAQPQVKA
jgi:type IV secretory pathway TraG/TraD family ATPase VirD4